MFTVRRGCGTASGVFHQYGERCAKSEVIVGNTMCGSIIYSIPYTTFLPLFVYIYGEVVTALYGITLVAGGPVANSPMRVF